jgi:hypothetical protein
VSDDVKTYVLKNMPSLSFAVMLGETLELLDTAAKCLHGAQAHTPLPDEVSEAIGRLAGTVTEFRDLHRGVKSQILAYKPD